MGCNKWQVSQLKHAKAQGWQDPLFELPSLSQRHSSFLVLKNERGNETGIWTYLVCSQLHYPQFPSSRALTHAFKPFFGRHRSFFQALLPTKERCLQKWRSANPDPDSCNSFGLNPECWRLLTARKQDALESPLLRIFTNLNIMTPVRRIFEQSEYHERSWTYRIYLFYRLFIEVSLVFCFLGYFKKHHILQKIWVPRNFFLQMQKICQHNEIQRDLQIAIMQLQP